jgi:hypothetical protein
MLVRLTPEEQRILDQYSESGLGTAITEMQNAYVSATAATRDEADRRYQLVTNLAAKLTPSGPPVSPQVLERRATYQRALPGELARVAHLSEPERSRALSNFKDTYFKTELESEPEGDFHAKSE